MDNILPVFLGIGLASACGFRVFIPMLAISIGVFTGHIHVSHDFSWLGTMPAIITFGIACLVEIFAYYIPWLDNLLDSITIPITVVCGTILAASFITGMSPYIKWTLAAICGGLLSALIKTSLSSIRAGSTLTTGGLANFILTSVEITFAVIITLLVLLAPFIAIFIVFAVIIASIIKLTKKFILKPKTNSIQG